MLTSEKLDVALRHTAFTDPRTGDLLRFEDRWVVGPRGDRVASIVDGIPRFVDPASNYAESFGYQWNRWKNTLSDDRNSGKHKWDLIRGRTHFDEYDTEGKTILECGMGGGDDTEVLLRFPFAEVHAFDLSTAVERAAQFLEDPRLTLSQASIFDIPYADQSFDFVYCHRVLQHTPDPPRALRCVCRKVKPGGVLFAHCYKRSWKCMMNYKYKFRWLTRRVPYAWVDWYVETFARPMNMLHRAMAKFGRLVKFFARQIIPFEHFPKYGDFGAEQLLELEKLVTFDALTPRYDNPLTARRFCSIIEEEGFRIEHLFDRSPLFCTAVKIS